MEKKTKLLTIILQTFVSLYFEKQYNTCMIKQGVFLNLNIISMQVETQLKEFDLGTVSPILAYIISP